MINRFRQWLQMRDELEHRLFVVIVGAGTFFMLLVLFTDWSIVKINSTEGSSFLSALIQGLTTMLALLVTLSLLATQQAATTYTPRAVQKQLKDFWLWSVIILHLIGICWAILAASGFTNSFLFHKNDDINIALILGLAVLLYLIPFIVATMKQMDPLNMALWLVRKDDIDSRSSLDDFMRKVVNEVLITLFNKTLALYKEESIKQLNKYNGSEDKASERAALYLSAGRHACQRGSPDGLAEVMRHLTELTTYCNKHPRLWRGAADVFNRAIKELYEYSEYCFNRKA